MSYSEADLMEAAREIHHERILCDTCYGDGIHTKRDANSLTETATVSEACKRCDGSGRLWDRIPLDPDLRRGWTNARLTDHQLIERVEGQRATQKSSF